jgi:hypothetical protein
MQRSIFAIAAAAFLTLPVCAFADGTQTQPATAQPASAQPVSDPQKPICRMMTHQGMLVKTNVCHTQAEWDEIRQRQQRDVADFQNRNYQTSSGH